MSSNNEGRTSPERFNRVFTEMRKRDIDALLVVKPENVFYLSSFNPVLQSTVAGVIVRSDGSATLLCNALRAEHAQASTWISDIRVYGNWSTYQSNFRNWLDLAVDALRQVNVRRLGVESGFLPAGDYLVLKEKLPDAELVSFDPALVKARSVKTPEEVDHLRIAAHIASTGMAAAIAALRQRGSEQSACASAQAAMNKIWMERWPDVEVAGFSSREGGIPNALSCYCLSGPRVGFNCDVPRSYVPNNELVMLVVWGVANSYFAEIERTVAVGTLAADARAIYEAMLQIRTAGLQLLAPGLAVRDLYAQVVELYKKLGYARYIPGRIGHGMGVGTHENPSLGAADDAILEPGMVFTFEPNIRVPGLAGAQHSDTVVITEQGYEFLTSGDRGMIYL